MSLLDWSGVEPCRSCVNRSVAHTRASEHVPVRQREAKKRHCPCNTGSIEQGHGKPRFEGCADPSYSRCEEQAIDQLGCVARTALDVICCLICPAASLARRPADLLSRCRNGSILLCQTDCIADVGADIVQPRLDSPARAISASVERTGRVLAAISGIGRASAFPSRPRSRS